MTECSKVVQEIDYKFFPDYESAVKGINYSFAIVEVNGTVPPSNVIKTVLIDSKKILPLGDMALTGVNNLGSARFQLVKIQYNVPVKPYGITEDVYIFESLV